MDLSRILHRLPDVRLRLDARNEVLIEQCGQLHAAGPHALRLLEIFAQRQSVADALEILKPSLAGTQDWLLALRTIQQLESAGILLGEDTPASLAGFDQPSIHIAMLNDRSRTEAFIQAIRQTVKPGDVVVDIGTGTGVLAAAAVQAGASKVYAIEAGTIRQQAASLFAENGMADRVTIIPGWSTQVSLPEQVDVVVGEVLGNDPFGEDIADTFQDAVRRFLKPGGKVIPARADLLAVLVNVPCAVRERYCFEQGAFTGWEKAYGLKFSALGQANGAVNITIPPQTAREWPVMSQPVLLRQMDLLKGDEAHSASFIDVEIIEDGEVNALLLYFTASLGAEVEISTSPAIISDDCHWRNVVRLFPARKQVRAGQTLRLDCSHGYSSSGVCDVTTP